MADDRNHNSFMSDEPAPRNIRRDQMELPDGNTRAFSLEPVGKEPPERCEERSSIQDLPTGALIWRILRPLVILLISVALVWLVGSGGYHYVVDNYIAPVESDTTTVKTVKITAGSSLSKIASQLHDDGIIRNKFVFQLYVDFNDMSSKLQAGTYDLSPGMTIEEVMETLVAGDGEEEIIKITFTEGMTVYDMGKTLVTKGVFDESERQEFLKLCNDTDTFDDYAFIAALPDDAKANGRRYLLEGYLFPDTYEVYADATPEQVIRKLLDRFDYIFSLDYEERAEDLGMTIDQVMTLASIIEWEAQPADFKKVSAVFYNRIAKDMKLQSDATLRYVTGEKKLSYTATELAIDSPYNTYAVSGLPIGPISNPGQQAIEAALYPDEDYMVKGEEYYYFSLRSPDSTELAFAKTLEEHNANVAAYEAAAASDNHDATGG